MNILLTPDNELRSGWRFIAYILFFLILWVAGGLTIGLVIGQRDIPETPLTLLALNAAALAIPAIGVLIIMLRFVDHLPLTTFGVALHEGWFRDFLTGLGIAAGMLLLVVLIGIATSSVIIARN